MAINTFQRGEGMPSGAAGIAFNTTLLATNTPSKSFSMGLRTGNQLRKTLAESEIVRLNKAITEPILNQVCRYNSLPNNGRGTTETWHSLNADGTMKVATMDPTFGLNLKANCTAVPKAAMTYNSSTYGGGNAAVGSVIESLVAKTGQQYPAYNNAYIASEFTMANDPGNAGMVESGGESYYQALHSFRKGNRLAMSAWWFRVTSGKFLVYATRINGVLYASSDHNYKSKVLTPADGWVHLFRSYPTHRGARYDISIYGLNGAVGEMALPFISASDGIVLPEDHMTPIY